MDKIRREIACYGKSLQEREKKVTYRDDRIMDSKIAKHRVAIV